MTDEPEVVVPQVGRVVEGPDGQKFWIEDQPPIEVVFDEPDFSPSLEDARAWMDRFLLERSVDRMPWILGGSL